MTPAVNPMLRWAWRAWLAYTLVLVALVIFSLPLMYATLQQPCDQTPGLYCLPDALTSAQFADLQDSGFPVWLRAALNLAFIFTIDTGLGLALAWVLYQRQRSNWAALALALPLVSHSAAYPGGLPLLEQAYPWLHGLTRAPDFFVLAGWFVAFLIFPDGQIVPRWGRWLLLAIVPAALVAFVAEFNTPISQAINLGFALSFAVILVLQVYRYRRVSGPAQRAQARWVIYCLALVIAVGLILQPVLNVLVPALANPASFVVHDFKQAFNVIFGPVLVFLGFWLAILRARLWDIDLIIRRTLIYTALTTMLALVYFGSVVMLEGLLRSLTGGASQAAIVLSTLLIAALFGPLRLRIQRAIDQRFFRSKYDAAHTLAAFGASVRDDVDIDALGERLTTVVDETMQPAHIGLWAPSEARRPKQS